MTISFNDIPNNLRTPGSFIEFEPRSANWSEIKKVLLVGYANDGEGDANDAEIYPISRLDAARTKFGYTSMLARMTEAFKFNCPDLDLYAIALPHPEAAVNAMGSVVIDEAATTSSVFTIWIDGIKAAVSVAVDATPETIAADLAAAVNEDAFIPVVATATGGTVDFVARWPDALGNSITLSTSLYQNKNSVAHTLTAMHSGAGTPDLNDVFAAMGETQYHYMVNPFTDLEQLNALEEEVDSRFGPMRQIDGRVFMSVAGTYDECREFTQGQNCPHFTTMPVFDSPTPTWLVATINCAVASKKLDIDPARPLQDLPLPGVVAPTFIPTRAERNVLLFSGASTFDVAHDGEVQIERQITMYQKNDSGFSDDAYLDICVPETLSMMRWIERYTVYSKFPRWKAASDTSSYGSGQKIVTPALIRNELKILHENVFEYDKGWIQNAKEDTKRIFVEIHPDDPDRFNYRTEPTLIGQFRVLAGQVGFKS